MILTHRFFNYYRPVVNAAFALNYLLTGFSAMGYHLFNLLLHVCSAFLAGTLVLRIFRNALVPGVFGTLIFAVNPAGSEAVIWVSGRTDLLAAFFFLAALNIALWEPFPPVLNRILLYCAFVLAVFSKEFAVV